MSSHLDRVVVIGNAGIDSNVYLPGADIDFSVEGNFTENLDTVGQAGGYSARGYAALGRPTAFIGHVGDDYHGQLVRQTLTNDGIDLSALFIDPQGTARSVNIMYRDGRRRNFYDGKGHMGLGVDLDRCHAVLNGARLVHVHLPNWARTLLPLARAAGLLIAVDIQDVTDPHDPYRQDFIDAADVLFFSAANFDDPTPLIRQFGVGRPERVVVCGMGGHGCGLGVGGAVHFFPPPPLDWPVVDTNGAGDALAVGFLDGYVFGNLSPAAAVLRGQVAARHTCALRGTSDGLIDRTRLDALTLQVNQKMAAGN